MMQEPASPEPQPIGNYTLCVFTENSPGVLQRITVLFTRRKLNIESLTVSETETSGISRFTIVIKAERHLVEKVSKQIARIVEVKSVSVNEDRDLIAKEIALFEVKASDNDTRERIHEIVISSRAEVTSKGAASVIVEKTGVEEEVNGLYAKLAPFGILQFVRSGRIALHRPQ